MLKNKMAERKAFVEMEIQMLIQSHQLAYDDGSLTLRTLNLARTLAVNRASTLSISLLLNSVVYETYVSRRNKMHLLFLILDQHTESPAQSPGKEGSNTNDETEYDES